MERLSYRQSCTRNIFLDTEVFVEVGYNYKSRRLSALRDLAEQERVRVFLTDVTLREMRADLHEAVEKNANPKPPAILRNTRLTEVLERWTPLDQTAVKKDLLEQLSSFMTEARVCVLPIEDAYLPAVLEKYFDRKPPFATGKNKAEFPDALAIEALLKWCTSNSDAMAVVSRDAGVQACCTDEGLLRGYSDLSSFLAAVASEDEALSAFILDSLEAVYDDIDAAALEAFGEVEFHLSDEEGEVDSVEQVEVEWRGGPQIIYITPDAAIIEFPARFNFTVQANYYDSLSGSYDREDDIYMFRDVVDVTISSSLERRVSVDLALCSDHLRVKSADIEGSLSVGLRVQEEDPWD